MGHYMTEAEMAEDIKEREIFEREINYLREINAELLAALKNMHAANCAAAETGYVDSRLLEALFRSNGPAIAVIRNAEKGLIDETD